MAKLAGDVVVELMDNDLLAIIDAALGAGALASHRAIELTSLPEGEGWRIVLQPTISQIFVPQPFSETDA